MTHFDVIMAAYPTLEAAEKDFDGLVALVKEKKVRTEGVILVEHDMDGEVHVSQTADHLGRKGLGWGGGVGVLVGLAAPPLLASVAVGAAAGGLIGKFTHHKVKSSMESGLGDKLKPGTAAVIAMVDRRGPPGRGTGARRYAGQVGRHHGQERRARPERRPCRGRAQVRPRPHGAPHPRPRLRGRHRPLAAQLRGRLDDQHDADAPRGRPNVLLVLIDDAGFGNPSTFGGPIDTPTMTRVAEAGLTYDHFHVTALCSPTRAALLTGRNHHTVGFGSVGEFPGPFPGYTSSRPKDCAPFVRVLQGNGYSTGGFGKWHLTPDHVQGPAEPESDKQTQSRPRGRRRQASC